MNIILGIDTSCYTTSVAAVNLDQELIGEHRQLLRVPAGERGLQQSQAVFQHVQNLPVIFENFFSNLREIKIKAVASSIKPRPVSASYMPVFTVSESHGKVLASALKAPFWPTSHQEGHLFAGLWSSKQEIAGEFLAVHLSGGTSEILLARSNPARVGLNIEILGGTKDLHAGQFIDRVGVRMGLSFPAGPQLEQMAKNVQEREVRIPSSVDGYDFSFSGSETCAQRLIDEGTHPGSVARAVESCIATTIEKVLRRAVMEIGLRKILVVGGVAANGYLRERLKYRLEHPAVGAKLIFAQPGFSSDNAVGVALAGVLAWNKGFLK